ncbi:MAG: hypothetical protein BJ554DRAFT_6757 [Olpidium bornovanus]|uniref:Uncharacterized protein n=1 Tax=Olpidium bornovanus TaxID=278681 RepID=A0A8H7ZXB5_9FUNG|nr:MAG: hypothetical protein BJ554DRAFT_6757 [Olpidium bornovanus]
MAQLVKHRNTASVGPPIMDPTEVCHCPAHARNMHALMYGAERDTKPKRWFFVSPQPSVFFSPIMRGHCDELGKEAAIHRMPYAGQPTPPWKSAFAADYTAKLADHDEQTRAGKAIAVVLTVLQKKIMSLHRRSRAAEAARQDALAAHFLLSTGNVADMPIALHSSTTQRDYIPKGISVHTHVRYSKTFAASVYQVLAKEAAQIKPHMQPRYPPIFVSKDECKPTRSLYKSEFVPQDQKAAKPDFRLDRAGAMKTNVRLGDEDALCDSAKQKDMYESVTKKFMLSLPDVISPVHIVKPDRSKSNVLHPWGPQKGEMQTTQRTGAGRGEESILRPSGAGLGEGGREGPDYTHNDKIDRKSLMVDNVAFTKDLKATHFQLGSPDTWERKSQYQAAYRGQAVPNIRMERRCADTDDVELRDDPKGRTEQSTNCLDYLRHPVSNDMAREARLIKILNSKPSVSLSTLDNSGRFAASTTSGDAASSAAAAAPWARKARAPKRNTGEAKLFDEEDTSLRVSTVQADYTCQPLDPFAVRIGNARASAARAATHISFGSDPPQNVTTTAAHFGREIDPGNYRQTTHARDPRSPPRARDVIPGDAALTDGETYTTVSRKTYTDFGKVGCLPAENCTGSAKLASALHLDGGPTGGLDEEHRLVSTHKRPFVPPVSMKYVAAAPTGRGPLTSRKKEGHFTLSLRGTIWCLQSHPARRISRVFVVRQATNFGAANGTSPGNARFTLAGHNQKNDELCIKLLSFMSGAGCQPKVVTSACTILTYRQLAIQKATSMTSKDLSRSSGAQDMTDMEQLGDHPHQLETRNALGKIPSTPVGNAERSWQFRDFADPQAEKLAGQNKFHFATQTSEALCTCILGQNESFHNFWHGSCHKSLPRFNLTRPAGNCAANPATNYSRYWRCAPATPGRGGAGWGWYTKTPPAAGAPPTLCLVRRPIPPPSPNYAIMSRGGIAKGSKRQTLTDELPRAICQYQQDNPSATQRDIVRWVEATQKIKITETTVSNAF